MAGFSLDTTPPSSQPATLSVETEEFDLEKIKKFWLEENIIQEKLVALVYGQDGTCKSGLVAEYLTDEDIKAGKKMLIIDLDGGFEVLLPKYHKERCEKAGKKLSDVFIVKNPLILTNGGEIDYKSTYNRINEAVFLAKNLHKELNLKAIVFDGLTTALNYAENIMRIEKNLTIDGGANIAFWKIRNKRFLNPLEQIKSLPISSFLIGHENFILNELDGDKNSSVMVKTSAMVHQKVRMSRTVNKATGTVVFKATVDKSKNNVRAEGNEYNVIVLNKNNDEYELKTSNLFKDLL